MTGQRVSDEQLTEWTSNPSYYGTREFVRAVIADLRAAREESQRLRERIRIALDCV